MFSCSFFPGNSDGLTFSGFLKFSSVWKSIKKSSINFNWSIINGVLKEVHPQKIISIFTFFLKFRTLHTYQNCHNYRGDSPFLFFLDDSRLLPYFKKLYTHPDRNRERNFSRAFLWTFIFLLFSWLRAIYIWIKFMIYLSLLHNGNVSKSYYYIRTIFNKFSSILGGF